MRRVRYGPRTAEELQASRDARRTVPDVWSYGVTAVWETHPEIVAAVLPPPLEPGDRPLVRVNISQVDIAGSECCFRSLRCSANRLFVAFGLIADA